MHVLKTALRVLRKSEALGNGTEAKGRPPRYMAYCSAKVDLRTHLKVGLELPRQLIIGTPQQLLRPPKIPQDSPKTSQDPCQNFFKDIPRRQAKTDLTLNLKHDQFPTVTASKLAFKF